MVECDVCGIVNYKNQRVIAQSWLQTGRAQCTGEACKYLVMWNIILRPMSKRLQPKRKDERITGKKSDHMSSYRGKVEK